MAWLMGEMLLCLLLAFLLGLLIGWLWTRWQAKKRYAEIESEWRQRLDTCEERLADVRTRQAKSAAAAAQAAEEAAAASARRGETVLDDEALRERLGLVDSGGAVAAVPGEPAKKDDLKKIEGIGPKIEQLLNEGDIHTWAQLAEADVDRLRQILTAAGERYRVHDPSTWPEQAALAAEGQWQQLEVLQDLLDGGRRPG